MPPMSDHVLVWTLRGPCLEFLISRAQPFRANRPTADAFVCALERSMAGRLKDFRGGVRQDRPSITCLWVAADGLSFLEYELPPTEASDRPCYSEVSRWVAAEWVGQNGYELPLQLRTKDDPRAPTTEQLRAVTDSLGDFRQGYRFAGSEPLQRESHYYPLFVALADALNAVRPVAASCPGWPDRVRLALPAVIETFDAVAEAWGWGPLARPEPERSTYRAERFALFAETIERPRYESALSIRAGWRKFEDFHPTIDAIAEEGKAKQFAATMTPEEGAARLREAERACNTTFRLGTARPEIGEPHDTTLSQAYHLLKAAVAEAERQEPASTPAAIPRPPSAAENKAPASPKKAKDPVEQAANLIVDSPESVRLIRFLKDRKEQKAHLDEIAVELGKTPRTSASRRRGTIRQRYNRARDLLEEKGAPVRLTIEVGVVRLIMDDPPEPATPT
jgi:hypothetical protein